MGNNDYDEFRRRNISERNAVFAEFFSDLKKQAHELAELGGKLRRSENEENEPPRKRRKTLSADTDEHFRANRVRLETRRKYNTRSRTKSLGPNDLDALDESDEEESKNKKRRLKVLFPWAKSAQRSIDLMAQGICDVDEEDEDDDDEDDLDRSSKNFVRVNRNPYDPDSIPSVDEITEKMIDNVATKSSLKQYCKVNGTSCHQCRQKTLDTKTVCRSGECIGVRGQFCGPCLRGRYGESAVDALKDPNWACPPCRGLCNCSICRTRNGLRPTGILSHVAQEEGFTSVMDYLQSVETDDT